MILRAGEKFLFPPRCFSCGVPVEHAHTLCHSCWQKVRFITAPHCSSCGRPFAYDAGENAICGTCFKEPPPYEACRSALVYDDAARPILTRFKYADRSDYLPALVRWLEQAGGEMLAQSDVIVPVPLHVKRLLSRKYNQSALLAKGLADESGLPVYADGLIRKKHTPPQAGLSQSARKKNVQGAFEVNAKWEKALEGKRVLLVDDVMTTGATIHACTKALLRGGAAQVRVVTIAQTLVE